MLLRRRNLKIFPRFIFFLFQPPPPTTITIISTNTLLYKEGILCFMSADFDETDTTFFKRKFIKFFYGQ